jgi:hypothetical protein
MALRVSAFLSNFVKAKTKNAGAVAKAGGPEGLPLTTSANLICYNSRDHGVRHACDKDGERKWQRQRLKQRIALL